ncbi:MAG: type II toxin-antitoxin system VapC family toxin [Candidatus Geothermarchaeales archaeon]
MPVLETDFLKGVIDPQDKLYNPSMEALKQVGEKNWYVASSAFIELDLLLKNSGMSIDDRIAVFQALKSEIPKEMVLTVSHQTLSEATLLQRKYYKISHFYFDSIHLAVSIELDNKIVSSDKTFDQIEEIERTPLEKL